MVGYIKVKHILGRRKATDDEILELYKHGWFLNRIRYHYKVGFKRLRRITREYDKVQKQGEVTLGCDFECH